MFSSPLTLEGPAIRRGLLAEPFSRGSGETR
jgi:hypothetical protein